MSPDITLNLYESADLPDTELPMNIAKYYWFGCFENPFAHVVWLYYKAPWFRMSSRSVNPFGRNCVTFSRQTDRRSVERLNKTLASLY